jgi:large subunit ribosomal protein L21
MYAVIKTGGKQYTVRAGDLLVVEKLDGNPGAELTFGDVLMVGDGDNVTVGAPLVDGVTVAGTLIETRKGEKIKIFKKIRRQGYRRTRGHRQLESVVRVTAVGDSKWDGTVDLTPKALLDARARGLKGVVAALEAADASVAFGGAVEKPAKKAAPAPKAAAPKAEAKPAPAAEQVVEAAPVEKPKKAEAPKAKAKAEAPKAEAKAEAPKKAAAPKAAKAEGEAKKPAAPKAKKTEK